MGDVLTFRPQVDSGEFSRSREPSPVQIIFFPGVRYERWNKADAPKDKKRARGRDKLELND